MSDHYNSAQNKHNCHANIGVKGLDHERVKLFVLLPGRLFKFIEG